MVDVHNPATTPLTSNSTAQPSGRAARADGNYQGQRVALVQDPVAMLEDSAEELSFVHSEKVEKKLAKRKLGKTGIKSFAMKQAEHYLRQVNDLEKNKKLAAFAKQVAEMHKSSGPKQLQEFAAKSYPDVSHQFLALSYARDLLQEDGADSELVTNLGNALTQLEARHGPQIYAGINVSQSAAAAAEQGVGTVQGLRDLYRDVVLDYKSITQAYNKVVKDCGKQKFIEAVGFLLDGLATEVEKDNRSLPKSHLKAIMDDMYQLKLLGGMYHQCDGLMDKVHNNYNLALSHGGQALLEQILELKEKGWYSDELVEDIAEKLNIDQVNAKIYFFKGLKDLIRLIPYKAFDDENKRAELTESVQHALDKAINQEFEA